MRNLMLFFLDVSVILLSMLKSCDFYFFDVERCRWEKGRNVINKVFFENIKGYYWFIFGWIGFRIWKGINKSWRFGVLVLGREEREFGEGVGKFLGWFVLVMGFYVSIIFNKVLKK